MTMNEKTIEAINEAYENKTQNADKLKLNVRSGLDTIVCKGNWEICSLSDLSTMIEELTQLRDTIETEIGIRF